MVRLLKASGPRIQGRNRTRRLLCRYCEERPACVCVQLPPTAGFQCSREGSSAQRYDTHCPSPTLPPLKFPSAWKVTVTR